MYDNIVGLEQIIITVVFLILLIGILIFLRKKSAFIKSKLNEGKRIILLEEAQISPVERLKLFSIEKEKFLILSTKGQATSIMQIFPEKNNSNIDLMSKDNNFENKVEKQTNFIERDISAQNEEVDNTILLTKQFNEHLNHEKSLDDFSTKFKSWRNNK